MSLNSKERVNTANIKSKQQLRNPALICNDVDARQCYPVLHFGKLTEEDVYDTAEYDELQIWHVHILVF